MLAGAPGKGAAEENPGVAMLSRTDTGVSGRFRTGHLACRLDAEAGVADLGILTLNALLAARPRLLGEDPELTAGLARTAGRVLDGGRMSSSARQALAQVCYALRLHTR